GLGLFQQRLGLAGGELLCQPAPRLQVLPGQGRAEGGAEVAAGLEEPCRLDEAAVPVVEPGGVAGATARLEEGCLGLPVAAQLGGTLYRASDGRAAALHPRRAFRSRTARGPLAARRAFATGGRGRGRRARGLGRPELLGRGLPSGRTERRLGPVRLPHRAP